jgi:hypothetical protein
MIRKIIILFSLCCVVLCAFVGYLSFQVTQESEKAVGAPTSITCESIFASPLSETSHVTLTEFAPLKHLAMVDKNGDNQWDDVCVPFFPKKQHEIGNNYRAVLVCFKGVPTRNELDVLIDSGELDVNFWPERQKLDVAIHSQLAQKYTTMDLAKSPVFYYGFEATNPVLGEASLYASAGMGLAALLAAFLAMISSLFVRKDSADVENSPAEQVTTNRAGLPVGESVSILDQIGSTRSVLSE